MADLDSEQTPSRRLWILAAVGALALHVGGGALAVVHLQTYDLDDSLGAPAIELPKDVPAEADDPDRVVTPNDSNKPKEEDSKIAAVQTNASTESVAAEATATPSSEAIRKGPRSTAPAQGIGESVRRARLTWQKELMAHLEKHKRYPAERTQKSAEILVGFALDRMGHVLSTSIVKGSGDKAFDAAALAMVRHADPVPQPPPLVADEGLNFTLPVIFKVKGKS